MNIKQVGLIDRIFQPLKSKQFNNDIRLSKQDKVILSSISTNKIYFKEKERLIKIVQKSPDLREYHVNKVKKKLINKDYLIGINKNKLAENILKFSFKINY